MHWREEGGGGQIQCTNAPFVPLCFCCWFVRKRNHMQTLFLKNLGHFGALKKQVSTPTFVLPDP